MQFSVRKMRDVDVTLVDCGHISMAGLQLTKMNEGRLKGALAFSSWWIDPG